MNLCPGCGTDLPLGESYCSTSCRHICAEIRAEYAVGRPLSMGEAREAWLADDLAQVRAYDLSDDRYDDPDTDDLGDA